jgi:hypothetical protein
LLNAANAATAVLLLLLLLLLLLQATPRVTGALALYASAHMNVKGVLPTAVQMKDAVMRTGVADSRYVVSGA